VHGRSVPFGCLCLGSCLSWSGIDRDRCPCVCLYVWCLDNAGARIPHFRPISVHRRGV
ncbi:StAR-related lipid transfer protein 3, partial [Clarias magur]